MTIETLVYVGKTLRLVQEQLAARIEGEPDPLCALRISKARLDSIARELADTVADLEAHAALPGISPSRCNGPAAPWKPLFTLHPTADHPGD